ncbi:5,6-dimethylbenzimidazole synthase [Longispora fulva]|uniref:5,6-dimethylbenzimidazole synthase n=1 Tax=Longispora fulva TaxID=619741 RepID=A0A8J7GQ47_9ACTN|nr:5,6-dimethylbenzimidazole synthase [Longispora fulva]MBG6141367.1 5,6-dimethylbenzimidazole synthase [Longispora fulva]GIG59483.1 5,6-dimethylbenzimidazole synthase [Longispora fulva]
MRFDDAFRAEFDTLLRWRRDVRHFSTEPLPPALVEDLLDAACLAPSVGNAQPWRFVSVDSPDRRAAIGANFEVANQAALSGYSGEKAQIYATLKLAGLREAPQQFAVFCDETTAQGAGLGRATMPETLRYSAVLAVHTLWLAARARGVGVGWVSILDPVAAAASLEVPPSWRLVAYLCLGYPLVESETPELERLGWQARTSACRAVLHR